MSKRPTMKKTQPEKPVKAAQSPTKDESNYIPSDAVKALRQVREKVDAIEDNLRYRIPTVYDQLKVEMNGFIEQSLDDIDILRQKMSIHEYHAAEQCELLTQLLLELDGIESQGNIGVKNVRKHQVVRIQGLLAEADVLKENATKLKRQGDELPKEQINEDDDADSADEKSDTIEEVEKLRGLLAEMKGQFQDIESKLQAANERIDFLERNQQKVLLSNPTDHKSINLHGGKNDESSDIKKEEVVKSEEVHEMGRLEDLDVETSADATISEIPEPEAEAVPDENQSGDEEVNDGLEEIGAMSEKNKDPRSIEESAVHDDGSPVEQFTRLPVEGNQFAVLADDSDSDVESTKNTSDDDELPKLSEGGIESVAPEHLDDTDESEISFGDVNLTKSESDKLDPEMELRDEDPQSNASTDERSDEELVEVFHGGHPDKLDDHEIEVGSVDGDEDFIVVD